MSNPYNQDIIAPTNWKKIGGPPLERQGCCYSSGLVGVYVNSLAPGKCEWNFRFVIFKRILVIAGWGISCEIALI